MEVEVSSVCHVHTKKDAMLKISLIAVSAVMFLYSTIQASMSDSFWTNAPLIIVALTGFLTAAVAGFIALWKFVASLKKDVKDYHVAVNSKMDLLLKEKDDNTKALETAKILADAIVAARNKGKLEAMEEHKKEELLRNSMQPNRGDVQGVKEIIKAVEEKGDETQDAIETKGDETHKVVKKIPDEVVKKLPPK